MKIIKKSGIKKILEQLKVNNTIIDTMKKKQSILIDLEKFGEKYKIQVRKGLNSCYYYQLLKF